MRVYVDTEYTYPGMRRGTPRPTAADKRQIVQIAAIIYDEIAGEVVAEFDVLTKPSFQRRLPNFFTELTGITQKQVRENGISIRDAIAQFAAFCGSTPVWTFDKDEEVFKQNAGYIKMKWPLSQNFVRVKSLLPSWGVNPDAFSSGTLYKAAGLDMLGHVHNALHDVKSMAAAVHVFETKQLAN